jgi:hypothetical protein
MGMGGAKNLIRQALADLALFRGASLSADRSHIAVGVTWAVTRRGIEAMLVLAVLEFGLELGLLSFRSPLPFALLNTSGSSQNSPRSAAPHRA